MLVVYILGGVTMLLYDIFSFFLINVTNHIYFMAQKLKMSAKEAVSTGVAIAQGNKGLFSSKKGNFNMLSNTAKSLVVFGIMIGVGLLILSKFQESTTNGSIAHTEIGNVVNLFSDITTWGAIVLIVIMGYVIMRYLGVFDGN